MIKNPQKSATKLKRHKTGSAYIDSTLAVGFLLGVLACSIFIASISWRAINPWWLGTAMATVAIYQMMIIWIINQYWDPFRIMGVFLINIAYLAIIIGIVPMIFQVQLPQALPILGGWTQYGITILLTNPGAVAISYGVLAMYAGGAFMFIFSYIEKIPGVARAKKALRLDVVDLWVDVLLDRFAFWIDTQSRPWFLVPLILLVTLCAIVVGSATFA